MRHINDIAITVLISISIHAPIVGCDYEIRLLYTKTKWISIHAPIVGCDELVGYRKDIRENISIHAPIVGCDDEMGSQSYLS